MKNQNYKGININKILDGLEGILFQEIIRMNEQKQIENDYIKDLKNYVSLKLKEDREVNYIYIKTLIDYMEDNQLIGYKRDGGKINFCFENANFKGYITDLEEKMNVNIENLNEEIIINIISKENVLLRSNIQTSEFNKLFLYNMIKEYHYDEMLVDKLPSFLSYYNRMTKYENDEIDEFLMKKFNDKMKRKNKESQKIIKKIASELKFKRKIGVLENFYEIFKENFVNNVVLDGEDELSSINVGFLDLSYFLLTESRLHLLRQKDYINLENDDFSIIMFNKREMLEKLTNAILKKGEFSELFLLSLINFEEYIEISQTQNEMENNMEERKYNKCVEVIFKNICKLEENELKNQIELFKEKYPNITHNRVKQMDKLEKEVNVYKMMQEENENVIFNENLNFVVSVNIEDFSKYITIDSMLNSKVDEWNKYVTNVKLKLKYKEDGKVNYAEDKRISNIEIIFEGTNIDKSNYNAVSARVFKEFVRTKRTFYMNKKKDYYEEINSKIREEILKIKLDVKLNREESEKIKFKGKI